MRLRTLWMSLVGAVTAGAQNFDLGPQSMHPMAPPPITGRLDRTYMLAGDQPPRGLPGTVLEFTFLEALTEGEGGERTRYTYYPESEVPTGRTSVRANRRRTPHGPAAYRTPDGSEVVRGQYVDGRAEGTWLRLAVATENGLPPCPAFFEATTHKIALAAARALYDSLDLLEEATVTEQRYRKGQLDGAARSYTLDGFETERAVFKRGRISEHELYTHPSQVPTGGAEGEQVYPPGDSDLEPFAIREQMPAFSDPSCGPPPDLNDWEAKRAYKECTERAMLTYIYEAVKYPESSLARGIAGQVTVGFVVERDGEITSVKAIRGVSALIDAEAERVIASMPAWEPGWQRGKAVRVSFVLPINFGLR